MGFLGLQREWVWFVFVLDLWIFVVWLDDGDWIFGFLNGYVNFIDGSLVEWDGGWVVVWLDDGG